MTATVLVNSDMGEALGLHSFGHDADLMPIIDAANIACGFHAGDPETMRETVRLAAEHGVRAGAHPGLPDLVGFGRREMKLRPEEAESLIRYQVGALDGFLRAEGLALSHLKPHGSLYGMLARDDELADAAARVAAGYGCPMFGIAGTAHERAAERAGVEFVAELYVDLDYSPEGGLIIERRPKLKDPAVVAGRVARALRDGVVEAIDGTELRIPFDSICIHSDTANCVDVAHSVREALDAASASAPKEASNS